VRIRLYNYNNSGWVAYDDVRLLDVTEAETNYYYTPSTGSDVLRSAMCAIANCFNPTKPYQRRLFSSAHYF
jgi:hypothetical protein